VSEEAQEKTPLSVYDLMVVMIDQTASVAWQKLGLQPDMMTGTIQRDIPQAKVAIDLVAYLAGQVEPKLDDEDRREMQKLVSNLRLNYVEKSREEGS
jgi:hypothetical protein